MAPVLICEGEQAAEAASQQFPDWVAVTSLHGAKAPQKSDWSSVATRDVTIWPDADEAGARFAAAVAQLVHEAGAASVRIVPVPNDVPAGWDLADPLPEGMDLARCWPVPGSRRPKKVRTATNLRAWCRASPRSRCTSTTGAGRRRHMTWVSAP